MWIPTTTPLPYQNDMILSIFVSLLIFEISSYDYFVYLEYETRNLWLHAVMLNITMQLHLQYYGWISTWSIMNIHCNIGSVMVWVVPGNDKSTKSQKLPLTKPNARRRESVGSPLHEDAFCLRYFGLDQFVSKCFNQLHHPTIK